MKHGLGFYKTEKSLFEAHDSIYKGYFNDDLKEGKGCMQMHTGDQYIGTFKNNELHGYGVLKFANGDFYEG